MFSADRNHCDALFTPWETHGIQRQPLYEQDDVVGSFPEQFWLNGSWFDANRPKLSVMNTAYMSPCDYR